jgi:hypothetical protein
MKRTTIFIPEGLEADLHRFARREKKSAAWVVREAISSFLATHVPPASLPSSVGMGASGRTDLSERFEDLLFADLTPTGHGTEGPRKTGRRGKARRRGAK